jgi:hypothetical protein
MAFDLRADANLFSEIKTGENRMYREDRSTKIRIGVKACLSVLFLILCTAVSYANESKASHVVLRESFSSAHRMELISQLQTISGWKDLHFDELGRLQVGIAQPTSGSIAARTLLSQATTGNQLIVVEDASDSIAVVFCRVIPGKWKRAHAEVLPTFILQIDFRDFDQLTGDSRALEAFNVAWGVMHELDHVVNDSGDTHSLGEAGTCESHINAMRRELHLPERAEYYFSVLPAKTDLGFKTVLVRLRFEEKVGREKTKRYWIIWDATTVGGTISRKEIATLQ